MTQTKTAFDLYDLWSQNCQAKNAIVFTGETNGSFSHLQDFADLGNTDYYITGRSTSEPRPQALPKDRIVWVFKAKLNTNARR